MSATDDGGQAFPCLGSFWNGDDHKYELGEATDGMSLRDYFAAKVLEGHMACGGFISNPNDPNVPTSNRDRTCAGFYAWADLMLIARQR